ncbi:DNA helicase [Tanacetum coccineum]
MQKSNNECILQIPAAPMSQGVWAYLQRHQNDLRSDDLSGLYDDVSRGDREGITASSKIMLPSTFTRGPRVFEQKVKDFVRFLKEVQTFGYVIAGPDRILAKVSKSIGGASTSTAVNSVQIDEIHDYVGGHFICPFEASWRIYDFPIHSREPAMQILNAHLEDMQRVSFRERDRLDEFVNFPEKRTQHLKNGDLFYFWMLLCHQKGCKSPIEVRTVHVHILPTYRAACEALGLLGDNKEWDIAFEESAGSGSSVEIRTLFAYILIYCDVADPGKLWTKHWQTIRDDIPAKVSKATGIPNYNVNTIELQGCILYELEAILNGFGKSITKFCLQAPPQHLLEDLKNKLLVEEKNYKRDLLMKKVIHSVPKLNHDQKKIYDLIINASATNQQELLFVYSYSGIASSGIASLPAGRTAHSRFKLPLELTDESLCHAKKKSSLDRTLRDLMNAPEILFGGKTVVLGGDFRQTLPVKKGAGKDELIDASIAESYIWWHFKICTLKENMRLLRSGLNNDQRRRSDVFAKWLLNVGNGEIGKPDEEENPDNSWITIPREYYVTTDETRMVELIDFIYNESTLKIPTTGGLQEKAIVGPKNDTAYAVNAKKNSSIEGHSKTYLSIDQSIPIGRETSETKMLYPMEYLNTITFLGFPPHELQLKVGSPIMLLINVNLWYGYQEKNKNKDKTGQNRARE